MPHFIAHRTVSNISKFKCDTYNSWYINLQKTVFSSTPQFNLLEANFRILVS